VGYAIKENVPRSWRRGVELAAAWRPAAWVEVGGNLTLSQNKIKDYTAYYEKYDNMNDWNYLGQKEVFFETTDILMSPSMVGMASATFRPFTGGSAGLYRSLKSLYLTWNGKYVGKQYYDNTSSDDRSIPAYFVADMAVGYEFPLRRRGREGSSIGLSFHVHNMFNRMYYANGWVYRAYFQQEDSYYTEEGIYPQAPANFMFKISWRL
jgi:iron complex outermembrane receptor protein